MKNCLFTCQEEVSKVINDYNQTFALFKTHQIGSLAKFNRVKAENRASSAGLKRKMLSKSILVPNLNLQRFPNFFSQLCSFVKTRKVKINIVPTLVLPHPVSFLSTDSAGYLQVSDEKTAFAEFLAISPKTSQKFPVFVFKPGTSSLEFIYTKEEIIEKIRVFYGNLGIVQHFIPGGKISPLLRAVADKTGNFQYFIIEDIKTVTGMKKKIEKNSLLARLTQKKLLDGEARDARETFCINDLNISNLRIHPFKVTDKDLHVSVSSLKEIVEKFTGLKFSLIFFDFIKDPSGKWAFFSCPCGKLLNYKFSEVLKSPQAPVTPIPDLEASSQNDSTVILQVGKSQETIQKSFRSKSYFSYSNNIDGCNESLGDKFGRVMNKIDRIRNGKKIPNIFATKRDLINEYQSQFNDEKNLDARYNYLKRLTRQETGLKKVLKKSNSKASTAESETCEKNGNQRILITNNCIFDSKTKIHLRDFEESVGRFDILMVNLKKSIFPTIDFPKKYGENIIKNFIQTLEDLLIPNETLINNRNELKCPGISTILNCKYNIDYEKRLISHHHPLKIEDSTLSTLSTHIIQALKHLKIDSKDLESISSLLKKLQKHLIISPKIT